MLDMLVNLFGIQTVLTSYEMETWQHEQFSFQKLSSWLHYLEQKTVYLLKIKYTNELLISSSLNKYETGNDFTVTVDHLIQ